MPRFRRSTAGFPANHVGVRDRLYLNEGPDANGRSRFREVGRRAGIEARRVDHGLGAVFTDVDDDGRLDLYVANDLDPNRLYLNVARPGGRRLGFRFEERARQEGVDDPNAGMGIAAADYSLDGREDLFVTNSRRQLHADLPQHAPRASPFTDARPDFVAALGHELHRLGRVVGRSRSRRQPRPRSGERRDPGHEPEEGCPAGSGAREPHGGRASGEFADASSIVGLPPGQRTTAVAWPQPTTTTTATSTSRSTRSPAG